MTVIHASLVGAFRETLADSRSRSCEHIRVDSYDSWQVSGRQMPTGTFKSSPQTSVGRLVRDRRTGRARRKRLWRDRITAFAGRLGPGRTAAGCRSGATAGREACQRASRVPRCASAFVRRGTSPTGKPRGTGRWWMNRWNVVLPYSAARRPRLASTARPPVSPADRHPASPYRTAPRTPRAVPPPVAFPRERTSGLSANPPQTEPQRARPRRHRSTSARWKRCFQTARSRVYDRFRRWNATGTGRAVGDRCDSGGGAPRSAPHRKGGVY